MKAAKQEHIHYQLHAPNEPKKAISNRAILLRRGSVLAVLAILIGGIAHFISAPVHGRNVAPDRTLAKTKPQASQPQAPGGSLDNDYFTLTLPVGYNIQANTQTPSGLKYVQTVTAPGSFGSLIISIAVKDLPGGSLTNDSSYALRQQDSARYRMSTKAVGGETVHLANDAESAAVVAFWPHGGYLATISATSSIGNPSADDNSDENRVLDKLLALWQWR